jgi:hypothetical protein
VGGPLQPARGNHPGRAFSWDTRCYHSGVTGVHLDWVRLPDAELLDRPIASLGLRIEGTALERRIARLGDELARAGLRFRPYIWLSTDWFTPDGVTGFAVPFYLAHPRLARLERRILHEVEGGTAASCMRLLRHEAAHAFDHAYRLRRRRRWRELFGSASQPYRMSYVPDPGSRRHVLNLDYWYAQSHPLEDFAETFAVWLQTGSRWQSRYAGWPALVKLEYVDALMTEIAERSPPVRTRARPDSLRSVPMTLREHYRAKQRLYRHDHLREVDAPLMRVFDPERRRERETAARFLTRHRRELRHHVSRVTGQHAYVVDQMLNELVLRARALRLQRHQPEREARMDCAALLTALTMSFLRGGPAEYQR